MELRPILSTLLRSKVGLILIGAQIALTLAIVCNALFIITQRFELMGRPSGVNETDTFMITSMGFGAGFNVDTMIRTDLDLLRSLPGIVDATPVNSVPLGQGGWSEGVRLDRAQSTSTTGAAIYFVDDHGPAAFDIDLVAGGRWSVPAKVVVRPVIDQSWDYALTMQFDTIEKHDAYQEDPDHQ
jgi:putative ABC transport system permease protein